MLPSLGIGWCGGDSDVGVTRMKLINKWISACASWACCDVSRRRVSTSRHLHLLEERFVCKQGKKIDFGGAWPYFFGSQYRVTWPWILRDLSGITLICDYSVFNRKWVKIRCAQLKVGGIRVRENKKMWSGVSRMKFVRSWNFSVLEKWNKKLLITVYTVILSSICEMTPQKWLEMCFFGGYFSSGILCLSMMKCHPTWRMKYTLDEYLVLKSEK